MLYKRVRQGSCHPKFYNQWINPDLSTILESELPQGVNIFGEEVEISELSPTVSKGLPEIIAEVDEGQSQPEPKPQRYLPIDNYIGSRSGTRSD